MKIPFSPPYIDQDVIESVCESLNSGWITTGPKVAALESELKDYLKAKSVIAVNSWTSGATLVLRWLGVKQDDEVIVPAYTYCATAMAVMEAGAKPVMVDISPRDLTIDVEKIREAITPRTKAIITVEEHNIFGGLGGAVCEVLSEKCPTKIISGDLDNRVKVEIEVDKCIGCTICKKQCKFDAIEGELKQKHIINKDKCVGCQLCVQKCPKKAIKIL